LFSSCNWKEASTPFIFRIQSEGSPNSPIIWLQSEWGYNPQCYSSTTGRWLQLPILFPSSRTKIYVKWWNHCHNVTVRYTIVNLYQFVPTNCTQPIKIACDQPVPLIFLYKQKPIGLWPVCAAPHVCTWLVCTEAYICTHPVYIST